MLKFGLFKLIFWEHGFWKCGAVELGRRVRVFGAKAGVDVLKPASVADAELKSWVEVGVDAAIDFDFIFYLILLILTIWLT